MGWRCIVGVSGYPLEDISKLACCDAGNGQSAEFACGKGSTDLSLVIPSMLLP